MKNTVVKYREVFKNSKKLKNIVKENRMQAQGEITQKHGVLSENAGDLAQNEVSKGHPIQDPFLNALRRQRVPVAIYLTNGIKLQGVVAGFDAAVILLKNNTKQMVYKRAVATVVPSRNIVWTDLDDNDSQTHTLGVDDQDAIENY